MINFKVVRWANFLSTGNQFTEVYLNRSKSTLIIGDNGAGKSTLIEALVYALYGKPFRAINKPQLVNSITNKNMLVEVEFSIGTKNYKIRRGMKPNIFEIYQDNKLIEQNSEIKEYQDMLEKTILKMNIKSFRQIIVLGSADYVPFMKLTPGDRRQIIEDLLDIQIFSIMNNLLKEKSNKNKMDIIELDHQINLTENNIKLHEKHIASLKTNNQELINSKYELITQLNLDIETAQAKIETLNLDLDEKIETLDELSSLDDKRKKIVEIETELESKKRTLNKEIKFFEHQDNCPTCKQDIAKDFKEQTLDKRKTKKIEIEDALKSLDEKLLNLDEKLKIVDGLNREISVINHEISTLNSDIRSWSRNIEMFKAEIESIQKNTSQIDVSEDEIQELYSKLNNDTLNKKNLLEERDILDISSSLLKDTGIKTRIIRQYVPVINKLVNKYLAALDFFVNFELDDKFNETIKSRFRDEFSYASFSEGEKFRIDLALMLTWRSIAKLRNSANTNILIMDEVFDSSLDGTGVEEFMKILDSLTGDTNVFVISHRGDVLYDKFHSILKFEKHSNFSRIAA